jgi:hypothetical protein
MKTVYLILGIFLLILILIRSCKPDDNYYDYRLNVLNKSIKTIYVECSYSYPDTLLPYTSSPFNHNPDKAAPNETVIVARGGSWEEAFKERIHDKLIIFIFEATIVDNTPWDTVKKNYMILKRYDLNLHDLNSLNWTITYP